MSHGIYTVFFTDDRTKLFVCAPFQLNQWLDFGKLGSNERGDQRNFDRLYNDSNCTMFGVWSLQGAVILYDYVHHFAPKRMALRTEVQA